MKCSQMSEAETSMKGSTASTVEKPKIELEGKTILEGYYKILYNGNHRCMYNRKEWEARLKRLPESYMYGFILRHRKLGIDTPIIWFE